MSKVLIVTEAIPHPNKGGASQTLFNIFKNFKQNELLVYTPSSKEYTKDFFTPFISNIIFINSFLNFRYPQRLRFLHIIQQSINDFIVNIFSLYKSRKLVEFQPDIILVCPLGFQALKLYEPVVRLLKKPAIVYFMDDWPVGKERIYDRQIRNILKMSDGQIFISEYLRKSMESRLDFQSKNSLILHNPVDVLDIVYANMTVKREGTFRITYAGSLWAIQLDAVMQMARAVGSLRQKGVDIVLSLYTNDSFYNQHKDFWKENGIEYGGWIPYATLKSRLISSDILLVASSFLPEYRNLTLGSLQTKVTDYLAASRPVLCLGPNYSANNLFIKKWNCGMVFESTSVEELSNFLLGLIPVRNNHEEIIRNGLQQLETNFNTKEVDIKLKCFLKSIID